MIESESAPRGYPRIAWAVILLTATLVIIMHTLPGPETEDGDSLDLLMLRMQSQYIMGTRQLIGADERILDQTTALNTGSVTQRQCYVALTSELAGPEEAAAAFAELNRLIDEERYITDSSGFELTQGEERVQRALTHLFLDADGNPVGDSAGDHLARVAALPAEHRNALTRELGWFGELVMNPKGAPSADRDPLLAESWRITVVVIVVFGTLAVLGVLGLAGLVVLIVLATSGKVQSGLGPSTTPHGIYAETFAVWMVLFVLLQLLGGILAAAAPGMSLAITAAGFVASLIALAWPLFRGVSFDRVRAEVGLIAGRQGVLEPLFGVGGYLLALPMLAVGILATLLLMVIDSTFAGEASTFASASPPAHPIVNELAHAGWGIRLQVLFLAAVVAPIVEETMFRGALYRHLRDATSGLGLPLSVLISATFNGLLFAGIHPQGWVAIPALMSLAFSFVLLREWRGTLIPSMIVHGISNGLVMLMLIAILGT